MTTLKNLLENSSHKALLTTHLDLNNSGAFDADDLPLLPGDEVLLPATDHFYLVDKKDLKEALGCLQKSDQQNCLGQVAAKQLVSDSEAALDDKQAAAFLKQLDVWKGSGADVYRRLVLLNLAGSHHDRTMRDIAALRKDVTDLAATMGTSLHAVNVVLDRLEKQSSQYHEEIIKRLDGIAADLVTIKKELGELLASTRRDVDSFSFTSAVARNAMANLISNKFSQSEVFFQKMQQIPQFVEDQRSTAHHSISAMVGQLALSGTLNSEDQKALDLLRDPQKVQEEFVLGFLGHFSKVKMVAADEVITSEKKALSQLVNHPTRELLAHWVYQNLVQEAALVIAEVEGQLDSGLLSDLKKAQETAASQEPQTLDNYFKAMAALGKLVNAALVRARGNPKLAALSGKLKLAVNPQEWVAAAFEWFQTRVEKFELPGPLANLDSLRDPRKLLYTAYMMKFAALKKAHSAFYDGPDADEVLKRIEKVTRLYSSVRASVRQILSGFGSLQGNFVAYVDELRKLVTAGADDPVGILENWSRASQRVAELEDRIQADIKKISTEVRAIAGDSNVEDTLGQYAKVKGGLLRTAEALEILGQTMEQISVKKVEALLKMVKAKVMENMRVTLKNAWNLKKGSLVTDTAWAVAACDTRRNNNMIGLCDQDRAVAAKQWWHVANEWGLIYGIGKNKYGIEPQLNVQVGGGDPQWLLSPKIFMMPFGVVVEEQADKRMRLSNPYYRFGAGLGVKSTRFLPSFDVNLFYGDEIGPCYLNLDGSDNLVLGIELTVGR